MQCLERNDLPYPDHGVEVMYRVSFQEISFARWIHFVKTRGIFIAFCGQCKLRFLLLSVAVCRFWSLREIGLLWQAIWSRAGVVMSRFSWTYFTSMWKLNSIHHHWTSVWEVSPNLSSFLVQSPTWTQGAESSQLLSCERGLKNMISWKFHGLCALFLVFLLVCPFPCLQYQ